MSFQPKSTWSRVLLFLKISSLFGQALVGWDPRYTKIQLPGIVVFIFKCVNVGDKKKHSWMVGLKHMCLKFCCDKMVKENFSRIFAKKRAARILKFLNPKLRIPIIFLRALVFGVLF